MQWKMNKLLGRAPSTKSQSKYKGILLLIIESGAIYALSQVRPENLYLALVFIHYLIY